jgi:hypothetical protein
MHKGIRAQRPGFDFAPVGGSLAHMWYAEVMENWSDGTTPNQQ